MAKALYRQPGTVPSVIVEFRRQQAFQEAHKLLTAGQQFAAMACLDRGLAYCPNDPELLGLATGLPNMPTMAGGTAPVPPAKWSKRVVISMIAAALVAATGLIVWAASGSQTSRGVMRVDATTESAPSLTWVDNRPERELFAVMAPGPMRASPVVEQPAPYGTLKIRTYNFGPESKRFSMLVMRFPDTVDFGRPGAIDQMIADGKDSALRGINNNLPRKYKATLRDSKDMTILGYRGYEMTVDIKDVAMVTKMRAFVVPEARQYIILMYGVKGGDFRDEEATRFFDSLRRRSAT